MHCCKEEKDIKSSSNYGCSVSAGARIEHCHHPCWTTGSSLQLVDQIVDGEALGGELVAVGQVLQTPDIGLAEDLVGGEGAGLSLRETKHLTIQLRDIYISVRADM